MNKSSLLTVALSLALLALSGGVTRAQDNREPELSTNCTRIAVSEDHKVSSHVYAVGVQVYRWNGTAWTFVAPVAVLYANEDYDGEVGTHYVGPTWESNSGSKVVATRVDGCTPDSNSIPWLLLKAVTTEGPGIFHRVTYIQRVNTVGGIAPTTPGTVVGQEMQVPYTAEYVFYRAKS